ncbi:MAG: hypothetical protein ACAH59_02890 [Pseudobdellovibrionaceae bacterium]
MKQIRQQKGQVVVEYVLLLTIAVSLAMIVVSQLIKRDADDPSNSGAMIQKWQQMQEAIGKDEQK